MDNLDKKLIIHVVSEVVIIGGISFWLYNKISTKDAIIERLEKENKELLLRIQKIENFLQAATGDQYSQQPPPQQEPRNHPHKKKKKKKSQSPTASEEESVIKSSEDQEFEV